MITPDYNFWSSAPSGNVLDFLPLIDQVVSFLLVLFPSLSSCAGTSEWVMSPISLHCCCSVIPGLQSPIPGRARLCPVFLCLQLRVGGRTASDLVEFCPSLSVVSCQVVLISFLSIPSFLKDPVPILTLFSSPLPLPQPFDLPPSQEVTLPPVWACFPLPERQVLVNLSCSHCTFAP